MILVLSICIWSYIHYHGIIYICWKGKPTCPSKKETVLSPQKGIVFVPPKGILSKRASGLSLKRNCVCPSKRGIFCPPKRESFWPSKRASSLSLKSWLNFPHFSFWQWIWKQNDKIVKKCIEIGYSLWWDYLVIWVLSVNVCIWSYIH